MQQLKERRVVWSEVQCWEAEGRTDSMCERGSQLISAGVVISSGAVDPVMWMQEESPYNPPPPPDEEEYVNQPEGGEAVWLPSWGGQADHHIAWLPQGTKGAVVGERQRRGMLVSADKNIIRVGGELQQVGEGDRRGLRDD